ncbi:MAG: 4-hydroxythreonine-4-phosphate dehydrogenase PdxA [Pseudolabrys sp.]|nr:4-hydroxythreonine-4-phosphate dehydrogenase PdxA [Pseudolabrys sp.]MDP2297154.1 4-hydroxythreonine-4-phosphate dehydrogenase PdxA [Pseudolabrys sp.]
MSTMVPRICIAMGDPAGVSPELLVKLLAREDLMGLASIAVIGDRRVLAAGEKVAGKRIDIPLVSLAEADRAVPGRPVFIDLGHLDPATIEPGQSSAAGGTFAMRNFREALLLGKAGRIDGIMFTPFNKLALKLAGNPYPDEIRWAADILDWKGSCSEYNRLDDLWNARVTSHEPMREVADLLTRERVGAAIDATDDMLRGTGIARPRIAVAGYNPHAGEGGVFGREEIDVIAPAVEEAKRRNLAVDGPFPADTVWIKARRGDYDAVLTMYHDQGQIALKLLGFERGVTILGGLPVPIATPAHGTAYDIVGRGIADPSATIKAFETLLMLTTMKKARAAA